MDKKKKEVDRLGTYEDFIELQNSLNPKSGEVEIGKIKEVFKTISQAQKVYYDTLVEVGFDKVTAIELISRVFNK